MTLALNQPGFIFINEMHVLTCSNLNYEPESQEYEACTFNLYDKRIHYRTAKITPKKSGLFVPFWKRSSAGPIEPFDVTDPFDFLMVSAGNETQSGFFIFSTSVLLQHGCLS